MKLKCAFAGLVTAALVSCTGTKDPNQGAYPNQPNPNQGYGSSDPYSSVPNPYGVPSNTPQPAGEVGQYRPAPYQPIPGVPTPPPNTGFDIPSATPSPSPAPTRVQTHVVAQGDSIWGLSKKYGTTQDAIRQANGIEGDLIRVGQTLQIPR